jgi:hypothetical protein
MVQKKRGGRSEVTRLADVVQRAVDEGANTVEEIHKAVADLPLEVLGKLDIFEETVKDVRKIQDTSIGAIYDVIHQVNREVAKLARELAKGTTPRKTTTTRKTSKRATKRPSAKA